MSIPIIRKDGDDVIDKPICALTGVIPQIGHIVGGTS